MSNKSLLIPLLLAAFLAMSALALADDTKGGFGSPYGWAYDKARRDEAYEPTPAQPVDQQPLSEMTGSEVLAARLAAKEHWSRMTPEERATATKAVRHKTYAEWTALDEYAAPGQRPDKIERHGTLKIGPGYERPEAKRGERADRAWAGRHAIAIFATAAIIVALFAFASINER